MTFKTSKEIADKFKELVKDIDMVSDEISQELIKGKVIAFNKAIKIIKGNAKGKFSDDSSPPQAIIISTSQPRKIAL